MDRQTARWTDGQQDGQGDYYREPAFPGEDASWPSTMTLKLLVSPVCPQYLILKWYSHAIWDNKFMFDIRVDCWWHWYQYLKSETLWPKNQLIMMKATLLWFVHVHRCLQTTRDCCGIAHPGHHLKSGLLIKAIFHLRYIISFVYSTTVSNHCKKNWNKQYFTCNLNIFIYLFLDPT